MIFKIGPFSPLKSPEIPIKNEKWPPTPSYGSIILKIVLWAHFTIPHAVLRGSSDFWKIRILGQANYHPHRGILIAGKAGRARDRRSSCFNQEKLCCTAGAYMWSRQRQAHAICVKQGRDLLRRGQFRQVSCETSLFLVFVLFFYFGFWSFLFWYFVYIFLFSFSGAKTQFPLLL